MKKRLLALLLCGLLLMSACSSRSTKPKEGEQLQPAEDLDPQASYGSQRPDPEDQVILLPPETEDEEPAPSQVAPPQPLEQVPILEEPQPQEPATPAEPTAPTEPTQPIQPQTSALEEPASPARGQEEEVRAVWFSYFELEALLKGKNASAFTAGVGEAFDRCAAFGLNTVLVQVRPYGDAIYPSDYFPWSYLATGTEGGDPGFDPLAILVREAHNRGLAIEAWINPYRVRNANYNKALSDDNPAKELLQSGDAISYNGGIYYNPASSKAQKLIVNGVKELVENYRLDGIHFDDYFYPTTDAAFDADSYGAYKAGGGSLSLADWRRQQVDTLVKAVYQTVHAAGDDLVFGISPQGNLDINYNSQYIDVARWLSQPGYVDYICPQVYYGFENGTCPYEETVEAWNQLVKADGIRLYVGLAPFKIGLEDTWAGSGKGEWQQNSNLLSRMVDCARKQSAYQGFALFRYDSLFAPAASVKSQVEAEKTKLQGLLD